MKTGDMRRQEEILAMIHSCLEKLSEKLRGYEVILFGSRADGTARSRSDFDIGILGDRPLDVQTLFSLRDMLDELPTLYTFDVVDLNTVSARFREEALKSYKVLHGEVQSSH